MDNINKILIFLVCALIYSSIIYLIGLKQETEIEITISNSLINDLYLLPNNITLLNNQTLNESTHLRVKLPVNIADIILASINNGV